MGFDKMYRESFLAWCLDQGVEIDRFVSIRESETGGTGVFFDVDGYIKNHGDIQEDDRIVLLRVPKKLTLSLDSIAENLLTPQLQYDKHAPKNYIKQANVFQNFLTELTKNFQDGIDPFFKGGLNETNILVGEVQILTILKKIRDQIVSQPTTDEKYKTFLRESPFASFDRYLDLLFLTDVNSLKLDDYYEAFKTQFKYNQREYRFLIEKAKNLAIYSALDSIEEDIGFSLENYVDIKYLQKIEISVISRILEIPEPIEDHVHESGSKDSIEKDQQLNDEVPQQGEHESDGYEEDVDDDGTEEYGFAVSSTMVPVVDFVNHSNDDVNATFDIDIHTRDVILRFMNDTPVSSGEIELFITYSEYEDVYNFINAYGFIPRSTKTNPIYEHAIDRDYLDSFNVENEVDGKKYVHNLGNLLKWMGQPPNIQFVLTYEGDKLTDVKLNLDQNFIIFGFTKGLKYHRDRAIEIVKELQGPKTSDKHAEEVLELEESPASDLVDSQGQTPYTLRNVDEYVDLFTIIENTTDEEIDTLMIDFIKFLLPYFKYRIKDLDNGLLMKAKDLKSIIVQFGLFEREILKKFIEIASNLESEESFADFIIGAEEIDNEWLKYRLNPRYVSFSKKLELQKKHLVSTFNELEVDLI